MLPRWVTVAYLAYLVAPILLLLVGSFGGLWLNTLLPTGFTGRWYLEVAADPSFRRAFNASLPLQLYSLISETGSDFPAAAALALLITAACSSIMAAGEWVSYRHERHLRYR